MTSHYRTQSLDRRDRSLVERDFANQFGVSPGSQQNNFRSASNEVINDAGNDVTATAWRRTAEQTGKGQVRVLRKSGLTTSRSGELTLSSGSETIQRLSRGRYNSESSSAVDHTSLLSSSSTDPDSGVDSQRAILTVNTVSNVPAAASRSKTLSVSGDNRTKKTQATTGSKSSTEKDFESLEPHRPRRSSSTSFQACQAFDEQLSEWTTTLDKLSKLSTNVVKSDASTTKVYPTVSGRRDVIDEPPIERQSARRNDWQSTLPNYIREPARQSSLRATTNTSTPIGTLDRSVRLDEDFVASSARSRVSGERGYASDSEDSMNWLERQRNRLNSGRDGRRWAAPPRTDVERRLIAELRASQEKLFGSQLDDLSKALDDNGNVQTNRKYFTIDSKRSTHAGQYARSFDGGHSNGYTNGYVNGYANGHGGGKVGTDYLERSSTLGRTPVMEERVTKTTVKKTNGGYDPRRLDTLDSRIQRSSTLPRRWQPGTRPSITSSSDRSDSGYNTEWSKHTFESPTVRTIADFNRDAMRNTIPLPTKLIIDDDEEIRLKPIGLGYQTLEQPSLTTQLNRRLMAVQAEHSDSSTSLSTQGVQNGIVNDQHQYQQTVSSQPQNATSQPAKTLIDYASTWHQQHQHRPGQSFPATSFNTERQTGLAWSQTLPGQHQRPTQLQQPIPTSTLSASRQHPGTYQRGHRRTQSSSNIIEYGTGNGNGYAVGIPPQTSDGDYDRLDDRYPLQQPALVVQQLDLQQPKFATLSHPPQFQQVNQFPLVGPAVVNSPQFVSVYQQQQQQSTRLPPTASTNNRHRRTHSTGLVDQFRDGAGVWSPQQQYATLNEGLLQSQTPRQQQQLIAPVGVNGDAWGTSFVGVQQQRSAGTSAPFASNFTGSLPRHYGQQQQQQQPVAPPIGHRVQQMTVNNVCYEPQTLLRLGPGDMSRQTVQPSTSFNEFRQVTSTTEVVTRGPSGQTTNTRHAGMRMGVPEIVPTQGSKTSVKDRTSTQNATVGYLDGTHNGFSTADGGAAFQHQPRQGQQQLQQQQPQQTQPSWQQQQQSKNMQSTTLKSPNSRVDNGRPDPQFGEGPHGTAAAVIPTPQQTVNGSTTPSWQQQSQQQQQQQQQPNMRQQESTVTSPLALTSAIATWDMLLNAETDNGQQSGSAFTPGNGTPSEPTTAQTDAIDVWDRLLSAEIENKQLSRGMITPDNGTVDRRLPPVGSEFTSTPQQRQQFVGSSAEVTRSSLSRPGAVSSTPISSAYPPIAPEDYTIKRAPGSGSQWTRSPQERNGSLQQTSGNWTDTMDNSSLRFSPGRSSIDSLSIFGDNGIEPPDLQRFTIKFVKDSSKQWYRPDISREEAVAMLKNQPEGAFVVRNSNSFPGAFALAIKVSQLPATVLSKGNSSVDDLVRNFLIESTSHGVRVKGNKNEPVFGSLAALIYQHSVTPLSLPCKLLLPSHTDVITRSTTSTTETKNVSTHQQLLQHGAACLVVYINTVDVESLTGDEAIERSVTKTLDAMRNGGLTTTLAQFKVAAQGVTLTDNNRRIFFRRHYKMNDVIFSGLDRTSRRWTLNDVDSKSKLDARIFGFVSRKPGTNSNECHVLAEYEPEHPASDVVEFLRKTMVGLRAA